MDECHVLLQKKNMVSPAQWAKAIAQEGFDFKLDTSYEIDADDGVFGYRPCSLHGQEVGFELSYSERSEDPEWFEEWEDDFEDVAQYDFCVSFGIRDDSAAIYIAGSVLAKVTGGVYVDVDEPMDTAAAIKLAKVKDHAGRASGSDA